MAGVNFYTTVSQQHARDLIAGAPVGSPFHSSMLSKDIPIAEKSLSVGLSIW